MGDETPRAFAEWRAEMAALAARMRARAQAGKDCVLTPYTALMASQGLSVWAATPRREELGHLWCSHKQKCDPLCNNCLSRANEVMQIYAEAQRAGGPQP
jgi:hypothetical protein